jgi:hypothetical protein
MFPLESPPRSGMKLVGLMESWTARMIRSTFRLTDACESAWTREVDLNFKELTAAAREETRLGTGLEKRGTAQAEEGDSRTCPPSLSFVS